MKEHGIATQVLAGEIVAAVLADEQSEGCDISAGMFGFQFSELIRRLAAEHLELAELRAAKTARDAT